MQLDTYVVIPTFNEADNIEALIQELLELPVRVGVIVVDDNSPDGTGELAKVLGAQPSAAGRVNVIHRPGKLGLGTAYVAGLTLALGELGASKVMTMDADFSHPPRDIPALVELRQERHFLVGSRYVPGGGTANWPFWRQILSGGSNTFARLTLGLKAHDGTAGFRLYHRQVLEAVPPESIKSSGYSFLVEMLFNCEKKGFTVGEVPIIFEDRRQGASKISKTEIFKAVRTVFRLMPRRFERREPPRPIGS